MAALRYRGVLLDIDGTVVDSNDAHARAWVDAFAAYGHHLAMWRVRPLVGMGGDKIVSLVGGLDAEFSDGRSIAEARRRIFERKYLPHVKPTPGAEHLLEWLRRADVTITVATSATRSELAALLALVHATSLVPSAASSDDAEDSKPDPDILVAALRRSGIAADETIMLGDTPYDIQAAQQAGIPSVAFRSGGWLDHDLHGAIAIYDHPADLLAQIDQSPFFV